MATSTSVLSDTSNTSSSGEADTRAMDVVIVCDVCRERATAGREWRCWFGLAGASRGYSEQNQRGSVR